jgi:hypothetical protein
VSSLTNLVEKLFTSQSLSVLGTVCSIASLVLTLFVLYDTRKLRSYYKLRVRAPALLRDLKKSSSALSDYLNEFAEFLPQISEELARIAVKLKSLEGKLSGGPKASVKKLRRNIDQCEVGLQNEEQVRRVNVGVIAIIEEVRDHQKDLDWES